MRSTCHAPDTWILSRKDYSIYAPHPKPGDFCIIQGGIQFETIRRARIRPLPLIRPGKSFLTLGSIMRLQKS
ncbi:MAG: hypothetical protein JSW55_11870 [Chloroflexota bacterium]|nr:MAG: hypothetical protein JSW55_11870 [Chloroflexota bacterium]